MTNLEVLYRELAKEQELPVSTVEAICRVQFRLVRETLEGDTFASVRLPYFCSFQPIDGRVARFKESKRWDPVASKTRKP